MSPATTELDLQKLLDNVQFTRNLGLRLHSIGDGACVLDVPFQAAFERPGGIVSGQVFMAAADVAMARHHEQTRYGRGRRDGREEDNFPQWRPSRGFSLQG
jgi:acyl-coenzyme A thioesterase PaaI-like protein